jgi:hypothetical protein
MASSRLRPRLKYEIGLSNKEVLNHIDLGIKSGKFSLEGIVVQEHAFIKIPEQDQHYWSPEMHVWAREENDKTIVYGVIGPKPKIWTMFVFFYTIVITSTFFGGSYGIIQLILGIKADFLWSIPIGLFALLMIYGAAYFGQHKGRDQMMILQEFLDSILIPN